MNSLSDRLKTARKANNLSQAEVAGYIDGFSQSAYSQLESGKSKTTTKMIELARLFNVSADWLATGQGEMNTKTTIENRQSEVEPSNFLSVRNPMPIISWIAAGSWSTAEAVEWLDESTEYLPRPANISANGFCLRVRGVPMMPEFKPDEVIFVEPNVGVWDLKNGDLVVVRENGNHEVTFKQLIMGETSDDMYLKPLNPDWFEQKMTPKNEWELVGKVVGKWVRY